MKFMDELLTAKPGDMKAMDIKGNAQFKKKDYEGALATFNSMLATDADNTTLMFRKAKAQVKLGKKDEALTTLTAAIALKPESKRG